MAVQLQSTPITNALDLRATFLLNGVPQATLNVHEAATLTIEFDAIGIGSSQPLSMYHQQQPGYLPVAPGNVAYLDRGIVERTIVLRYGQQGGRQNNIVFVFEEVADASQ